VCSVSGGYDKKEEKCEWTVAVLSGPVNSRVGAELLSSVAPVRRLAQTLIARILARMIVKD